MNDHWKLGHYSYVKININNKSLAALIKTKNIKEIFNTTLYYFLD